MKTKLYGIDEYRTLDDDPKITSEYKRLVEFFGFRAEGVGQGSEIFDRCVDSVAGF